MVINIIIPVLNEENRLKKGIDEAIHYLETNLSGRYILTIVDNGSTDNTQQIAEKLAEAYIRVKYIKLSERGVGLALRTGVSHNVDDIVGYMDVDLSTDLHHIMEVYTLFDNNLNIDIVNGSRNSKKSIVIGRRKLRTLTSYTLSFIVRNFLGVHLDDYMCGFKFFRKEKVEELIAKSSNNNGWFYCAELLVRAEWLKYNVIEIPVKWTDEPENSKVESKILKISLGYLKEIVKLHKQKRFYKGL